MTTSTKTKKTDTEQDHVSASLSRLAEARAALRIAEAEQVETEARISTFRQIIKDGCGLPKGKTIAQTEDELSLSAIRIEGLTEQVAKAEDDHAYAVAIEVAQQVRELVMPLAVGDRVEEATSKITEVLVGLADEQNRANAAIKLGHRKLKGLSEDRYGKGRRVPGAGVGIDPNGWTSIRIDGQGYDALDPKIQAAAVLKDAEQRLAQHLYNG